MRVRPLPNGSIGVAPVVWRNRVVLGMEHSFGAAGPSIAAPGAAPSPTPQAAPVPVKVPDTISTLRAAAGPQVSQEVFGRIADGTGEFRAIQELAAAPAVFEPESGNAAPRSFGRLAPASERPAGWLNRIVVPIAAVAGPAAVPTLAHADAGEGGMRRMFIPAAAAAVAALAAAGRYFFGRRTPSAAGPSAVPGIDGALTDRVLAQVWKLSEAMGGTEDALPPGFDRLWGSIVTGSYSETRTILGEIAASEEFASISAQPGSDLRPRLAWILQEIPSQDSPARAGRWEDLSAVMNFPDGDSFALQARLSRLTEGLELRHTPEELRDIQISLTERSSHQARAQALARPVAGEKVLRQQYEDCWIQAFYHLPIAALAPLRRDMTYEQFLGRVRGMFPEKDLMIRGLNLPEFRELLSALGLKMRSEAPSEGELVKFIKKHGAVIGAVGWFDRDALGMDPIKSMRFWRQHAVDIVGARVVDGRRLFTVRDSLSETRYEATMEELDVMSLVVFVIEPESAPAAVAAAIGAFLKPKA